MTALCICTHSMFALRTAIDRALWVKKTKNKTKNSFAHKQGKVNNKKLRMKIKIMNIREKGLVIQRTCSRLDFRAVLPTF